MNGANMAAISLHALIRHQYQRKISTVPKPAPASIINYHTPDIELITEVTATATNIIRTVANLPAKTWAF